MLTLYLAKVVGLYFLVTGLALIFREKEIRAAERKFGKEGLMRLALGLMIFLGGLFFVAGYNDTSSLPAVILTVSAWLMLLKGLILVFMSDESLEKLVKHFDEKHWYVGAGAVLIIIGGYVASFGFGYAW